MSGNEVVVGFEPMVRRSGPERHEHSMGAAPATLMAAVS
jgi:hypothetical protein